MRSVNGKKARKGEKQLTIVSAWQPIPVCRHALVYGNCQHVLNQSASLPIITQRSDRRGDSMWPKIRASSWHEHFNRVGLRIKRKKASREFIHSWTNEFIPMTWKCKCYVFCLDEYSTDACVAFCVISFKLLFKVRHLTGDNKRLLWPHYWRWSFCCFKDSECPIAY